MNWHCLWKHDWRYLIDDTPASHGDPIGYRDVWAKCRRCGKPKWLHSGVFEFRTYNSTSQQRDEAMSHVKRYEVDRARRHGAGVIEFSDPMTMVLAFDFEALAAELADYKVTVHASRLRAEESGDRIATLESALRSQIARIDAWACDTRPNRAHEALTDVGQIARSALNASRLSYTSETKGEQG